MELKELRTALAELEDPRRTDRGHILHKLEDIIIIGLCTLLCNGEDFADMEAFGELREEWLRTFLTLPHGIPDSDTFRRVFERLDPKALAECLYDWLGVHWEENTVVAIDGKSIRGSKSESHKAYHVVSAFAAENQLVLGELVTEEKSNEITAVPELLDSLNVAGSIVTADAMSCQKTIVQKICGKRAEYVIGLKGNQPALLEDVSLYFKDFGTKLPSFTTKREGPWQNRKAGVPFADGFILAFGTDRVGGAESSWFRLFHCNQKWCNQHRYPLFHYFFDGYRPLCLRGTQALVH